MNLSLFCIFDYFLLDSYPILSFFSLLCTAAAVSYIHTHTHTHIHTYIHTYIHVNTSIALTCTGHILRTPLIRRLVSFLTFLLTCVHGSSSLIYTYTHIYIHTYTHIYSPYLHWPHPPHSFCLQAELHLAHD
jgi:hypothetical protein